jgi:hypothetical protein
MGTTETLLLLGGLGAIVAGGVYVLTRAPNAPNGNTATVAPSMGIRGWPAAFGGPSIPAVAAAAAAPFTSPGANPAAMQAQYATAGAAAFAALPSLVTALGNAFSSPTTPQAGASSSPYSDPVANADAGSSSAVDNVGADYAI